MKIVIDARMYGQSGIGRYIRNLIFNLGKLDTDNQYFILHLKKDYEKIEYKDNFGKVLADFPWYGVGEQIKLAGLLKSLKPDLAHFPHFNVPILYNGKFVVTIHDLIHQHFSMQRSTTHGLIVYKLKQLGYKKVFQNALKKSVKTLVPSQFVKSQLVEGWKLDPGKIFVTHEAVDEKILEKCQMPNVKCQMILRQLNIKLPYIFYVGNAHPHKNIEGLIKVFLKLKEKYKTLKLILAGTDHYFWQRIKKEYQDKNIIFTGQISDEQLVALYKNARCFVMPSFEEGFGIPILEAMACSCPVVSSSAGSLPEVGGNAAVYFDPHDNGDMADKIGKVLSSEKLREDLIKKGQTRVKQFSWEKLTKQTLEVYESCARS